MNDKRMSLRDAVSRFVRPGQTVAFEGFGHLNPVAASAELIRQGVTGLTIAKMTSDLMIDQFIASGVLDTLITSFVGNSSGGSLPELRRSAEGRGRGITLHEYSHGGMLGRYVAGASNMPFFPLRSYNGSDIARVNPDIRTVTDPYTGQGFYCVPPLNPDVTFIHAQRADRSGNVQAWGILGVQAEACFAAREVVVTVEEVVEDEVVRDDPNRTIVPSHAVSAVVEAPLGAYPASCQGYYDRDDAAYRDWSVMARDPDAVRDWLSRNIHAYASHEEFLLARGTEIRNAVRLGQRLSRPVDYGRRATAVGS